MTLVKNEGNNREMVEKTAGREVSKVEKDRERVETSTLVTNPKNLTRGPMSCQFAGRNRPCDIHLVPIKVFFVLCVNLSINMWTPKLGP